MSTHLCPKRKVCNLIFLGYKLIIQGGYPMKKISFTALAIFLTFILSTISVSAKDKKLDYSNMTYLDTFIYNKDKKDAKPLYNDYNTMAKEYLRFLELPVEKQKVNDRISMIEYYLGEATDREVTHTNEYGPNFYGSLSDNGLATLIDRNRFEKSIEFKINFRDIIFAFDDTEEVNRSLMYIALKTLQDKNPKNKEYSYNTKQQIGDNIKSRMKFIQERAILPKDFLQNLKKRLSVNRIYKLYLENYIKYKNKSHNDKYLYNKSEAVPIQWQKDNFFITPIVIGGYEKGFNPKMSKYLNIYCNANFTYEDAITSPPNIRAYIYDNKGRKIDILKPSYQYKSDYMGSFVFTIKNTSKYLKTGKYKVIIKMTSKDSDKKLYTERTEFFNVTYKNVYGRYIRVPIYPADGSNSRALKQVCTNYFKNTANVSNERLAYNIYKFITHAKPIARGTKEYNKLNIESYRSVYKNNSLLYEWFCKTKCLCKFSYVNEDFNYKDILTNTFNYGISVTRAGNSFSNDGKYYIPNGYNQALYSFQYALGIPPQEIEKYYKHYKKTSDIELYDFLENP
jgi:hypothetical protein